LSSRKTEKFCRQRKTPWIDILLETLALRCRGLTETQIATLTGRKNVRAFVRRFVAGGLLLERRGWAVLLEAEDPKTPLFSWRPGQALEISRVEEASRRGIGRWHRRQAQLVRVYSCSRRSALLHGTSSARRSRPFEISHDIWWAEVVVNMPSEVRDTVLKEEVFGRQHPVARKLKADAVVGSYVAETLGEAYSVRDMVAFARACENRSCAFQLW
jgi:hypothetical protein